MKQWITFNEPWIISILGYGDGVFPPGITGSGTNSYTVSHNLILAHAMAYRMYQSEFEVTQKGEIIFAKILVINSAFPSLKDWLE